MGEFGLEFELIRRDKRLSYPQIQRNIANHGFTLDHHTIMTMGHGRRKPTGQEVTWICEAMMCSDAERLRLHRAAAVDAGYMIEEYHHEPQA